MVYLRLLIYLRVTKEDLMEKQKRVNEALRNINIKVCFRYNYTALDLLDKQGKIIDTVVAGITKIEAFRILNSIETVLLYEGKERN